MFTRLDAACVRFVRADGAGGRGPVINVYFDFNDVDVDVDFYNCSR